MVKNTDHENAGIDTKNKNLPLENKVKKTHKAKENYVNQMAKL